MSQTESFLNDRSKDLLKKFMLGGALLGGGTMLAADLVNWLGHLNKKKQEEDDDTLYVYKDKEQVKSANTAMILLKKLLKNGTEADGSSDTDPLNLSEDDAMRIINILSGNGTAETVENVEDAISKEAGVGTGIAIAGGVGTAVGSGLLVHNLYTKFRRREAQKELDKAQHQFIGAQGYKEVKKTKKKKDKEGDTKSEDSGREKSAKSLSLPETVMSAPVALPLLLALGAGVTSYGMLDNAYPIKKPKPKGPRKIEIIEKPSDDQEEYGESTGVIKSSSYCEDDGREFLIRTVYMNRSHDSDLANLVGAVAAGDARDFCKAASAIGFGEALDTVKGGVNRVPDPIAEHLAISYLSKKASIKHQVGVLAAAEFATTFPHFYKAACALDPDRKEALSNISCIIGKAIRAERSYDLGITDNSLRKSASAVDLQDALIDNIGVPAAIEEALAGKAKKEGEDEYEAENLEDVIDNENPASSGDSTDSTGTSGQEAGIHDADSPSRKSTNKIIATGKTARKMMDSVPPDMIDKMLNP